MGEVRDGGGRKDEEGVKLGGGCVLFQIIHFLSFFCLLLLLLFLLFLPLQGHNRPDSAGKQVRPAPKPVK